MKKHIKKILQKMCKIVDVDFKELRFKTKNITMGCWEKKYGNTDYKNKL